MDLQQVHSAPPSSTIPFLSSSPSYSHHIFDIPPFVPVPLVSSFVPAFPVSLISVPMSPWSSCLSHIVFLPLFLSFLVTLVPLFPVPVRGWPVFHSKAVSEFCQLRPQTPSAFFRLQPPPSSRDTSQHFLFQAPSSSPQCYHTLLPLWPLTQHLLQRLLQDLYLLQR